MPRSTNNHVQTAMYGLRGVLAGVPVRLASAVSVLLFLCGPAQGPSGGSQPATIGVLAKRGAEKCLQTWGKTAEYLTAEIPGHSFTIRPLAYHEVGPAVARGEVGVVLANPALHVELERAFGASPIASLKNQWRG